MKAGSRRAKALLELTSRENDSSDVSNQQKQRQRGINVATATAAEPKKAGKNPDWDSGGVALGDSKDSYDFAYLTYPSCPQFTPQRSLIWA